jgi:C-terminal processing protease CtpA/Prc
VVRRPGRRQPVIRRFGLCFEALALRDLSKTWQASLAAALMFSALAGPASVRADDPGYLRLARLAEVWGTCKYLHPALAYGEIDWDRALVEAISSVREAASREEYAAAVQGMLAWLADPGTRVVPVEGVSESAEPKAIGHHRTEDGVLVLRVGDYYALSEPASRAELRQVEEDLAGARGIVFDLRTNAPVDAYGRFLLVAALSPLERRLTTERILLPGERRRVYYGFESQTPFASGQYRTGFFIQAAEPLDPAEGARDLPIVLILNRFSALPSGALALHAAGRAQIVFEGDPALAAAEPAERIDLGEGLLAEIRTSEAVLANGTVARLEPDRVVEVGPAGSWAGAEDAALGAAESLAHEPARPRREAARLPAVAPPLTERAYPEMPYPALEYRLLALFRLWNAIRFFYPYREVLAGERWEAVLVEEMRHFEAASDELDYARAVAGFAVRLEDSHAYVAGGAAARLLGSGYPPVRVRRVENELLVTALPGEDAEGAGVGDELVSVDGRDAEEVLAETLALTAGSTPWSRLEKTTRTFLNGAVGSSVELGLKRAGGDTRKVTLLRRGEDYTTLYHRERTGEVVRLLAGNIGYVDLDRLAFDEVDAMFESLERTRAIVFDMRGYPLGTGWAIASRLTDAEPPAALFATPLVGHGSPGEAFESFVQRVPPTPPGARIYRGTTLLLIDERTQSQAEHLGLLLRAANGTRFVGSRSAGANGEVTRLALPGGIAVGFTGQSVRYPDGTALQRVGLIPDVEAHPTVAGVRAGRDEVLEASLQYLGRQLSDESPPQGRQ